MTIALKYWKQIFILIQLIVIVFSIRSCNSKLADVELLTASRDSAFSIATYYEDKSGQLQGQVKTHEVTISQLKEHGEALGVNVKELKKQVGNLNNLVTHYRGKASIKDTILITNTDTVVVENGHNTPARAFKWDNDFLFIDGAASDKYTNIAYEYDVDFKLSSYYKKDGMFKKKYLVSDIYFSDPNFTVREFKGVIVEKPPKTIFERTWFKIGVGAVGGFLLGRQ